MKVYNRETSFRACDGGGAMRGESGGGGRKASLKVLFALRTSSKTSVDYLNQAKTGLSTCPCRPQEAGQSVALRPLTEVGRRGRG